MSALHQETLNALFNEPRTVNHFTDREISDETLHEIYNLTKMGPTAFNSQPLRITWLRSEEARNRLVPLMVPANQDKTAAAPVTALLSFDKNWHTLFSTFNPRAASMEDYFGSDEELSYEAGKNNAHIQAGYFITAIRALGLDAGPMTGADFKKITAEFFPESAQEAFLVVNLGYGKTPDYPRNARFEADQVTEIL